MARSHVYAYTWDGEGGGTFPHLKAGVSAAVTSAAFRCVHILRAIQLVSRALVGRALVGPLGPYGPGPYGPPGPL